jgi:RsiW-degrading membrane proteinase PrsW (M82 family)
MDLLLLAAVIPPLFLLIHIYRMDDIEREPRGLIVKLFIFGCITVIPAAIIEGLLMGAFPGTNVPSMLFMLIENFLFVALVEEGVKYIALKLGSWNNPAFNYRFDAVVYAVAVSLGFAMVENIMYVYEFGMEVAIMRAVTSIPGHCIFGIFMGYYFGMAKYHQNRGHKSKCRTYKLLALFMPMVLHGAYDYTASAGGDSLVIAFFVYVILLDIFAIRSIRKYAREDSIT